MAVSWFVAVLGTLWLVLPIVASGIKLVWLSLKRLTSPIGIVITTIWVLVSAFRMSGDEIKNIVFWIWKTMLKLVDIITTAFLEASWNIHLIFKNIVTNAFVFGRNLISAIKNINWGEAWNWMLDFAYKAFDFVVQKAKNVGKSIASTIKNAFTGKSSSVSAGGNQFLGQVHWPQQEQWYVSILDWTSFDKTKSKLADLASWFDFSFSKITSSVSSATEWVTELWNSIKEVASGGWTGWGGWWGWWVEKIAEDFNFLKDKIKDYSEQIKSALGGQNDKMKELNDSLLNMHKGFQELKDKGREEINSLTDSIKELKNEIKEIEQSWFSDIANRALDIKDELKEIDKNLKDNTEDLEKQNELYSKQQDLLSELALAEKNITEEDLDRAREARDRTETEKILMRMEQAKLEKEQKIKDLEEEKELKEKNLKIEIKKYSQAMEFKREQIRQEQKTYEWLVEAKKILDEEYFSYFGEQIEEQKRSIMSAIDLMEELRNFDNGGSQGQAWNTNINLNLGGVVVNNEADENRLVDKIKNELAKSVKNYNYWII